MTDSSLSRIPLGFTLGQELTLPLFDEEHSEDTEVEEEPLTKRIKMGSDKSSNNNKPPLAPPSSAVPTGKSTSLDSSPHPNDRLSPSPTGNSANGANTSLLTSSSSKSEISPSNLDPDHHSNPHLQSDSGSVPSELCSSSSDNFAAASVPSQSSPSVEPTASDAKVESPPKKKKKLNGKSKENDLKIKGTKVPGEKAAATPGSGAKKRTAGPLKGKSVSETNKRKNKKKVKRIKSKGPDGDEEDALLDKSSSSSGSEAEGGDGKNKNGGSSSGTSSNKKRKNRASHMRKNIREILSSTQLEEETLAAQREEQERIKRMNAKLQLQQQQQQQKQQQQQNHLVQLLNTATPSSFHHQAFNLSHGQDEIDKMFIRRGITSTSNVGADPSVSIIDALADATADTDSCESLSGTSMIPTTTTVTVPAAPASTTPDLIPISKFGPVGRQFPRQSFPLSVSTMKDRQPKPTGVPSTTPSVVDDIVILSSDDEDDLPDQDQDQDQEVITLDDQNLDSQQFKFRNQSKFRQQNHHHHHNHSYNHVNSDRDRVNVGDLRHLRQFIPEAWDRNAGLESYLKMNSFRSSGGTITSGASEGYCKTLTKLLTNNNNSSTGGYDGDYGEGDGSRDGILDHSNRRKLRQDFQDKDGSRGGGASDSSDDCVVISPPSFHEEIEKEGKEDENNVPDELGRVLVNVAHPDEDPDIFLAPQIARAVKPHQIGGIRFLYDNVVESLDQFETANGFGCILAHSMGLGKTIQAVSFCDIFLRYTRAKTVLIIVPINTIQNWVNEFNFWAPPPESSVDTSASSANRKGVNNNNNSNSSNKGQSSSTGTGSEKEKPKSGKKGGKNSAKNNPSQESPSQSSLDQLISQSSSQSASTAQSSPMNLEAPDQEELSSNSNLDPKDESSNSNNSKDASSTSNSGGGTGATPSVPADFSPRTFQVFVLNETVKTLTARERIITDWNSKGGVLLLGYEMYRMLALKRLKRSTKKKSASPAFRDDPAYAAAEEESSLEMIYSHIVRPGPDLVICDEGHRIKNSGASISQALKAIRTKRRIVLTGYPLQNNLMEYWCMVDFVRPNYLGSKAEFSNMFERPITNGQCVDSSFADKQIMRYRSHVLHTLLEGFVQRRSHLVLQSALPFKEEWVFLLKMTPIQYSLYKEFIRYLKEERQDKNAGVDKDGAPAPTTNPIKAFAVCCKIWNHPDALYNVVKKHEDVLDDLDLDDIAEDGPKKPGNSNGGRKPRKNGRNNTNSNSRNQNSNSNSNVTFAPPLSATGSSVHSDFGLNFSADYFGGFGVAASMANIPTTVNPTSNNYPGGSGTISDGRSISLDWATPIFKNYEAELLENGVKFQLLFVILEEVEKIGDKLLVFSQSLLTLDLMELFLAKKFNWKKNQQYFRLDGGTSGLEREKLICEFNQNKGVHLFLVSTRAGSLGINLIGANRVVVFDASWNPCHDAQAVCRVYRYGQKKECQIYRFVTDCSLEKRIYDRQINKRGIADRVVDEMNPEAYLNTKDVSSFLVLDHAQMDAMQETNHTFNMSKFTDPVLRNVLERRGDLLTKEPFEHESLLIDRKETKLSAKEKRQARRNYEMEKKQIDQPGSGFPTNGGFSYSRPSYAAFYPKLESSGSHSSSSFGGLPYSSNAQSDFYSNYPSSTYDSRSPSTIPVPPSYFNTNGSSSGGSSHSSSHNNMNSPLNFASYSSKQKLALSEQMKELQQIQAKRREQRDRELPYQALKEKGIDCRFMMLKKDAYMQDPNGGPEMYLRAGEKINIFRSNQGIYVRIANGRIIAVKPTSANSSLLQGIPLTGDVSTEKLQSLVYSLLRPAGKGPPPYYSSYVNPNSKHSSSLDLPLPLHGHGRSGHGHGHGHSHGTSSYYPSSASNNKALPSLQKLPPTAGLIPSPFHHNHQITNFRSNSGGDVTILRKMGGRQSGSSSLHSALESLNTPLPPPYSGSNSNAQRKYEMNIVPPVIPGSGSNGPSTGGGGSGGGNSSNSDDVEIIEFDTHFGEILNPSRVEDNLKKLQVSPRLSSSAVASNLSGSNTNSMSSGSLSPDMSITPIPPSVSLPVPGSSSLSNSNSSKIPLTLDSLLGSSGSGGSRNSASAAKRNFSSMGGSGSWRAGNLSGNESPVSSTTGGLGLSSSASGDGSIESLFWGLPESGSGKPGAGSGTNIPMRQQKSTSAAATPSASLFSGYDPNLALQNLLHNFNPNSNTSISQSPKASTASLSKLPVDNFRFLPNSDVNQFSHFFDEMGGGSNLSRSSSDLGIRKDLDESSNGHDTDVMEAHDGDQDVDDEIEVPQDLNLNGFLSLQSGASSGNPHRGSNLMSASSSPDHPSQYYNSSGGAAGAGNPESGNNITSSAGLDLSSNPLNNLKQANNNSTANNFDNLFGFSSV